MHRSCAVLAAVAAAMFVGTTTPAGAGPLNPPSGPVAPTGRTMILSLPYTISQPGSYYLAKDLTAASGNGITISASGVTLDLNGFTLNGSVVGGAAVLASGDRITVQNGFIRSWSRGLVGGATNARVRDIVVVQTGDSEGSEAGIDLGNYAVVEGCAVHACNRGIRVGDLSSVSTSVATGCEADGIVTGDLCSVWRCASANNGIGSLPNQILTGYGCVVRDCSVELHDTMGGISVGSQSSVIGCSARSTSLNTAIRTAENCLVQSCVVEAPISEGPNGISVNASSVVTGCSIRSVGGGIRASGSGCTIEGNRVTTAEVGIQTTGAGHFIASNKVTGAATPYSIAPGSTVGPIVNMAGGGTIATTNPWANFVY